MMAKSILVGMIALFLLSGCATPGMNGATMQDVEARMGTPALRWHLSDGTSQYAYPTSPMGDATYMVHFGADGRVLSLRNVLVEDVFSRIVPGMSQQDVLRLIGPPDPTRTIHFPVRNELAWEWPYCDAWLAGARFTVLFDDKTNLVRSTLSLREECGEFRCWCAR